MNPDLPSIELQKRLSKAGFCTADQSRPRLWAWCCARSYTGFLARPGTTDEIALQVLMYRKPLGQSALVA